ncbi:GNAT family N-acetyltransferase [candidate division WOR-3 bacterium]|uniref:GNAT family N-acetyltransferase n=1 Tax=candidate division WOR-3 bacterium TaxID=2052148 RepID=A0A9D5KBE2_UNCW3|nr:GNAT family N-acetyltransferase [candidate division WOR-3 bacterium]MBD3365059.1 GNAT family N-acetyltransferase [candidate division WOR-3 bacterium]
MDRNPAMISLRPARHEDKPGILKIASSTWEGWDYVPLFVDAWIEEGGLYVAENDAEIVGITKTTDLDQGELWLEAIRVSEEHRGKGWGFRIAREQLDLALAENPVSIRLSTADVNSASLAVIRRLGFILYAEFSYFLSDEPPVSSSATQSVPTNKYDIVSVGQDKASNAWEYITNSEEYKTSHGLLPHTWKFYDWTPERLTELIERGLVYEPVGSHGLVIFIQNRYAPGSLELAFIEGEENVLDLLVHFVQGKFREEVTEGKFAAYAAGARKKGLIRRIGLKPHPRVKKVMVFDYPLFHPTGKP